MEMRGQVNLSYEEEGVYTDQYRPGRLCIYDFYISPEVLKS